MWVLKRTKKALPPEAQDPRLIEWIPEMRVQPNTRSACLLMSSPSSTPEELTEALKTLLPHKVFHIDADKCEVRSVRRLSGGASQETWAIDTHLSGTPRRLIFRRPPGGRPRQSDGAHITTQTEAAIIRLAENAGAAVPHVPYVLEDQDGLGTGYFMNFIEGETIARKILRDEAFAEARPKLARQCGEHLARIHSISPDTLPGGLHEVPPSRKLAIQRQLYESFDYPHPVFEAALVWLEDNLISDEGMSLVHGDFRNGNLIIGPDGVRAVIDWELAHLGDPMEDLAWVCVNSWRFGVSEKPVGGFGMREELFEGYEAAGGGTVDPERVRYWEILGTLEWGIVCMSMVQTYKSGLDKSVERAAIGRRASETEIDLLNVMYPG